MRRIGRLDSPDRLTLLTDYLTARGVATRVDDGEIWVLDEDRVAEAKAELTAFEADPAAPKYADAAAAARKVREEEARKERDYRRQQAKTRSRYDRPVLARCGQTLLLAGLCIAVNFVTLFGQRRAELVGRLQISEAAKPGPDGWYGNLPEVGQGEVLRLITPIFPHADPLHLLFNLMWLLWLAPVVEFRRGPFRFLTLVLSIAVISNLAQFMWAGPRFLGISGVVAGLFGYLFVYGRLAEPEMRPTFFMILMMGISLASGVLSGPDGGTANVAHFAGLLAGMSLAAFDVLLLRLGRRGS